MLLMQYNQAMEISPMFAIILLLAVIGFLMNYAVGLVERRYCFWAQRANAVARTDWDRP
jgi:ABC-type nitrate/sulfonate/bicarbonate transport system permease component